MGELTEHRRRPRGGFTVIEIIVVVIIIGIAAMMAVPMLSSAASMQLRSAAYVVAADLEYAKNTAISTQRNYAVLFDPTNNRYEVKAWNGSSYEQVSHPVKKTPDYVVDFGADNRLDSVNITAADFDGSSGVRFDYLGSAYAENGSGSGAALTSGTVTLQAAGETKSISVTPVTGYITIQ